MVRLICPHICIGNQMDTLKTVNTTILLIITLIALLAFWYVTIAIVVIFTAYHVVKLYHKSKRILDE